MSNSLVDLIQHSPWWLLTSVGGFLLFALGTIVVLSYALFKYGKDIRQLNDYETIAKLASFAASMDQATQSYGRTAIQLQSFGKKIEDLDAILQALRGRAEDSEQKMGTLGSKLNAMQSMIEDQRSFVREQNPASDVPALNDDQDTMNWETIRDNWNEVRDALENAIEGLDVETRRRYSEATRYKYAKIIQYLKEDRVLSDRAALAATNMDTIFLKVRPRNSVIKIDDVRNFEKWKSEVLSDINKYNKQNKASAKKEQILQL